jgi:hypothetical protein
MPVTRVNNFVFYDAHIYLVMGCMLTKSGFLFLCPYVDHTQRNKKGGTQPYLVVTNVLPIVTPFDFSIAEKYRF